MKSVDFETMMLIVEYHSYKDLVESAMKSKVSTDHLCAFVGVIGRQNSERDKLLKDVRTKHPALTDKELLIKYQAVLKHHYRWTWPLRFLNGQPCWSVP